MNIMNEHKIAFEQKNMQIHVNKVMHDVRTSNVTWKVTHLQKDTTIHISIQRKSMSYLVNTRLITPNIIPDLDKIV